MRAVAGWRRGLGSPAIKNVTVTTKADSIRIELGVREKDCGRWDFMWRN